jgi:hypothetical protein
MATNADPIERLRTEITTTIKRGTDLLTDLKLLDDRLSLVVPSLQDMAESEREGFVARLCGYDPELPQRVEALIEGLADLVAGLTSTDGGAVWLRQHLDRLAAGEAEEAA